MHPFSPPVCERAGCIHNPHSALLMKSADVDTRTSYRKFSHYYLRKVNNTKYNFLPADKNIYSGSRHIGQNTVVTEDAAAIVGSDIDGAGFSRCCVVVEG